MASDPTAFDWDDQLARWYLAEPVTFLPRGEAVADGPLRRDGCYAEPPCHRLCCRPDGPFPTEGAARRWCAAVGAAQREGRREALAALWSEAARLCGPAP